MIINFDSKQVEKVEFSRYIYKNFDGQELDLIISYPKQTPKGCVIYIHGGGWKNDTLDRFKPHALFTALNGAVGVSISYRLVDETKSIDIRDGLCDCVDAVKYVQTICSEKYGELNYVAVGDSAGGYYALALGCKRIVENVCQQELSIDYVVNLNGINDLTKKWNYGIALKNSDTKPKDQIEREYSPIYMARKGDSPVYTVQGDRDKTVLLEDSMDYHNTLLKQGVSSQIEILSDTSHAFILFDYKHDNNYVAKIIERVLSHLQNKKLI